MKGMININDRQLERHPGYWVEQGKCPQCKRELKTEPRFTEEAWGRPSESYEVKFCTYCDLEVGGCY